VHVHDKVVTSHSVSFGETITSWRITSTLASGASSGWDLRSFALGFQFSCQWRWPRPWEAMGLARRKIALNRGCVRRNSREWPDSTVAWATAKTPKLRSANTIDFAGNRRKIFFVKSISLSALAPYIAPISGRIAQPLSSSCATNQCAIGQTLAPCWLLAGGKAVCSAFVGARGIVVPSRMNARRSMSDGGEASTNLS
jgi:hypothetical protein